MNALLLAVLAAAPVSWVSVAPSLVKIRPGAQFTPRAAISLELGRNECQAAQLVIAAGAPMFALSAKASRLVGPSQHALALDLSREVDLDIQHASNIEGRVGPWPDILIPAVDPIVHEKRNAFPYDAPGDVPTAVYAQVCVPADAPPGRYAGEVVVSARHHDDVHVPVAIQVLRYTLPATSTLPTAFGFSGISAAKAHGLDTHDGEAVLALTQRYAKLALLHRISLFGMTMEPPPFHKDHGKVVVDFRDYDRELAPFLDGTALPSGARFTSLELRQPGVVMTDADRIAYDRAVVEHLHARGWLGRVFLYAPDEPAPAKFPVVRHVASLAHQADPRIRVLVTASRQEGLLGAPDLWTPNMVCMFARPEAKLCPAMADESAYAPERAHGAKLWWYQSCMSHSCGPAQGARAKAYSGWPAYMVDLPAVENRAMGAAAYRYGIEGELYYSTTEAYDGDPWRDLWRFDGNGDGTLFYPGTPARIGGHTDVPLASLRLEYIRDGLQDYELLSLADKLGLHDLAKKTAAELVQKPWQIEHEVSAWMLARQKLAEAIDAKLGASEHASR